MDRQIKIAQKMASGRPAQHRHGTSFHSPRLPRGRAPEIDRSLGFALRSNGTLNAAGSIHHLLRRTGALRGADSASERGGSGQFFWLPQYFAQWRGRSLVVNDKYAFAFGGGQRGGSHASRQPSDFHGTTAESLSGVALRYGQTYQFRSRLADLTGGGRRPPT